MKVLLTGGSGFIGRHVLRCLLQKGVSVVLCGGRHIGISATGVEYKPCNLLDAEQTIELCRNVAATHLLHLAWGIPFGEYWTSAENLRWVTASQLLFQEFAVAGGSRIVGIGTGVEYAPVAEARDEFLTPTHPDTLYGRAKLACGDFLHACVAALPISGAWARLFYLLGPGENAGRLIPSACRYLKYGNPFCCQNGDMCLDYMDVRDAAEALVALLLSDVEGNVNIASGQGQRLRDMLAQLAILSDSGLQIKVSNTQNDEQMTIIASIDRLRRELSFFPNYTMERSLADCYLYCESSEL